MMAHQGAAEHPVHRQVRTPELDGIRGIAIALVLAFHLVSKPLDTAGDLPSRLVRSITGAGWLGVDLFFVLSGFLITGILMEMRRNWGDLRRFWIRRAFRTLPLYYAGLAAYGLGLWIVAPAGSAEAVRMGQGQFWLWIHAGNLVVALRESWDAIPSLLRHSWSLSVEEQFYLLWPLLVLGSSPRRIAVLSGVVVISATALRGVGAFSGASPLSIYVSLPTRVDALAMGSLLAAVMSMGVRVSARLCYPVATIGGLVLLMAFAGDGTGQYGRLVQAFGYPAFALLGTVWIASALDGPEGGLWRRSLRRSWLRWLGLRSYGIYLVHPIVAAALSYAMTHGLPGLSRTLPLVLLEAGLAVVLSVILAAISWSVFEAPLLRFGRRRYGTPAAAVAVAR